ncbi:MAG: roadblock/LC7 domain-containing protein [Candidatus Sericytochromatia bacterium]|nr:roadblock/LC7 domain-containing protein [Candidatus Sericytochromatia bacterium]
MTERHVLTRLVITEDLGDLMTHEVEGLSGEPGILGCAVLDASGLTLAHAGEGRMGDPGVAALVAASFRTLSELARMTGESAPQTFVLPGSETRTLCFCLTSGDFLIVQAAAEVPVEELEATLLPIEQTLGEALVQARQGSSTESLPDASALDGLFGDL